MIKINSEHEEIARYIVKKIADDPSHSVRLQDIRQYFTSPYRLHEYELVLKVLKDFDVIHHNQNDRLSPGKLFFTFKSLKSFIRAKFDWKFWIPTILAGFSALTAFYFSYTDRQKSVKINELEKIKSELQANGDSLKLRISQLDSVLKLKIDTLDKVIVNKSNSFSKQE